MLVMLPASALKGVVPAEEQIGCKGQASRAHFYAPSRRKGTLSSVELEQLHAKPRLL